MAVKDESRLTVDSLALMRLFRLLTEEDRRKVIDLTAALVRSPPISPR